MMAFFHPGDLDATGWTVVGLIVVVMLAVGIALIVGFVYLLYFLARKNGERINRKKTVLIQNGSLGRFGE